MLVLSLATGTPIMGLGLYMRVRNLADFNLAVVIWTDTVFRV